MVLYTGIILLIVLLTRILSFWGLAFLKNGDITLIPQVLYFSYVENRGAAFGIFQDAKWFLIVVSVALFLAITYYVAHHRTTILKSHLIPLAMVAGGGIANVADRLQFGYVVDYINVYCIDYPVFNLADICVVLGVLWIAGMILFSKEKR